MFFNDDKTNTNIDEEFGESFLSTAIQTISKYKFIFLGAIVLEIIILIMIYFGSSSTINYLVLSGDDVINIYKGTSYIETGFDAYNSDNEDLSDKVIVDSKLDANKVGEYEILYKLGDIVKIRKVNVVEKPDNYTKIGLKMVNNKVDVSLKVGQKYNEPGYEVTDKNLNDKVRIIGNVDTSTKGNYTLIYTVVDENDVTVNALRTVEVK